MGLDRQEAAEPCDALRGYCSKQYKNAVHEQMPPLHHADHAPPEVSVVLPQ